MEEQEHDDSEWQSIRDPGISLGMPRAARDEYGESITEYYRRKHSHGRYASISACISFRQQCRGDKHRKHTNVEAQ